MLHFTHLVSFCLYNCDTKFLTSMELDDGISFVFSLYLEPCFLHEVTNLNSQYEIFTCESLDLCNVTSTLIMKSFSCPKICSNISLSLY